MTKKSEYLEKYGFDIPFTEKELSLIGRHITFCEGFDDEIEMEGIVDDLRFGESTITRKKVKYLSVQFRVSGWWSREYPTEIKAPPIYGLHTENLKKEAMFLIKK